MIAWSMMRCPDLTELPFPPPGKSGWPWTIDNQKLPGRMLERGNWPLVSIVTPSYNQAEYLEETIRSVLLQGYPNLEYFVMDGGSTDNSVEIIKKYQRWITGWVSETDRGQSHAINKGFSRASGEWLGWLNSDDCYSPFGLFRLIHSAQSTNANFVFGSSVHFDPKGISLQVPLRRSPTLLAYSPRQIRLIDLIDQPSTLWTRELFELSGPLREDMHYAFDWDFFIRASSFAYPVVCPDVVAAYRLHVDHKTGSGGRVRLSEIISIYKDYLPSEYRKRFSNALPVISLIAPFSLVVQRKRGWTRFFGHAVLILINKSRVLSLFGLPNEIWVMLSVYRWSGRYRNTEISHASLEYAEGPVSNVDEALRHFPPSRNITELG